MRSRRMADTTSDAFADREMHASYSLRNRYQHDLDLLLERGKVHFGFLRWQHRVGLHAS